MRTAIVTGSSGLIGSEAARRLLALGYRVVGIDNDMRSRFFGPEASTRAVRDAIVRLSPSYLHSDADIRDAVAVQDLFREHARGIELVIHAAAQPSHDWAASDPTTDFTVNANGTLTLLEAARRFAKEATFLFLSTNKVYGDLPNTLPLEERERRWEIPETHEYWNGVPESMSIDRSIHSLFGVSKVAADLLVQEYGRYFGMRTACFRGGCLTGPAHAGTLLHGFLSYLMKCTVSGRPYTVIGYKGKQVRDNIHSHDLVAALLEFHRAPRVGEVYNLGGGRENSCSVLEAIEMCERLAGCRLEWRYEDKNRVGDHLWWISDTSRFRSHYPAWRIEYGLERTLAEIRDASRDDASAAHA
jgi:CDP-paratose 2-epimerase